MKHSIVLIGPHGAGKTTLGRVLAARLGAPFHGELGRELARDPAWRPTGATAEDAAPAFDAELFRRELARDLAWEHEPAPVRVVETWHLGNEAYAVERSPAVLAAWAGALRDRCRAERILVVSVQAPVAVLRARQSEPGSVAFYTRVAARAERLACLRGLPLLRVGNDGALTPREAVEGLLGRLLGPRLDPRVAGDPDPTLLPGA